MKKTLLSFVAMLAYVSFAWAQTTTYLDFEGAYPNPGVFGGSDFAVVANPLNTGVNTSAHVVRTQKGAGAQTWGGVVFPLGGTINFAPGVQTFTIDVLSDSIGSVGVKVELGTAPTKELRLEYTTPGVWQTLTADFSVPTDQTPGNLNLVIFMAFFTTDTDVWYWDNVKGPDFTIGAPVDVTFNLTDLGGTMTSAEVELSNAPGVKVPLTGAAGLWTLAMTGATGSTIMNPLTYTIYINGVADPALTNQPWVMAGSAPSTIAKNIGKPAPGAELLWNGVFDGMEGAVPTIFSGKQWGLWSGNGGVAEVKDSVAVCTTVKSGNNWDFQFIQNNFYLENGQNYAVTFDAWADKDRIIALSIEDPQNGYAQLGATTDFGATRSKWNIPITTVRTRYHMILAVDKMKANTLTKLVFLLAQENGTVNIDNVSLVTLPSTTYLDFEGAYPNPGVFGGSDFAVVANPLNTGVNTSAHIVRTQKGAGAQTWGGVVFPLGGTINFAPGVQTFTIDVLSDSIGSVGVKVELGTAPTKELRLEYTTPGVWQTLTADFSVPTDQTPGNLNLVIFMAFFTTDTDVWYWDNVKGPDFTVGAPVDVTFNLTDLGGTMTSAEVELSNAPGVKVPLTGAAGLWTLAMTGATGSTIMNPLTYTIYINGDADTNLTNQPWVMAGSAPSTIAKNIGKPALGAELLWNGKFNGIEGAVPTTFSGKQWGLWSGNGGVAEVKDSVTVCTTVKSGNNWDFQFIQNNFYLENGNTYAVAFDAWADIDRIIALSIEDPQNGYAQLGATTDFGATRSKWNIPITTVKTRYHMTLAVDKMKANTLTKFVFLLAQENGTVNIDNVSLVTQSLVSLVDKNKVSSAFYFDAVGNNLRFTGESGLKNVVVYNVLGTKVKEYNKVETQSINVNDLKTGVYVIRMIDNNGKFSSSKFIKK